MIDHHVVSLAYKYHNTFRFKRKMRFLVFLQFSYFIGAMVILFFIRFDPIIFLEYDCILELRPAEINCK